MTNNDDLALKSRVEKALEDFTNGRACMHVPAQETDVDLVLADCLEMLAERDADKKRIAALLSENAALKSSVENAAGCINAAYAEGLIDVLSESNDERLVDLVKRRLLFAYLPVETPATNEELIAIGDWVLREQLEDGTRVIKLLNKRIVELEAHVDANADFETEIVSALICSGHLGADVTMTQEALLKLMRKAMEARTVSVKLQRVSTKRESWTTWDWIQHLGGRYQNGNPGDYIEFGSVYAVQQMLKQFARTAIAQAQESFIEEIRSQLAAAGINLEVRE